MLSLMITCLGKNSTERAELANHITFTCGAAESRPTPSFCYILTDNIELIVVGN